MINFSFSFFVTITKPFRLIYIRGVTLLKKISLIFTFILLSIGLFGCQQSNERDTSSQVTSSQMQLFQGYVIEKVTEDGREKLLVVKGITKEKALEATFHDVTESEDHENIIWFVSEEKHFQEIEKGNQVKIWWDAGKLHSEPSILTLEVEKVKVIKE